MQRIDSLDDPRVAAYRNLRDRTLRGESAFVAEGKLLVERLIASPIEAESVFVAEEFVDVFAPLIPPDVPMFVAPERLLLDIVGFNFHRGILAVGRRPRIHSLDEVLPPLAPEAALGLAICPEITKPENMGLIFRSAAAFGLDGILLGQRCCDPFSRRALRLSMGAVFRVPFRKSDDLLGDLRTLKESQGLKLVATVLDPAAEKLGSYTWPRRAGVLFGNEFEGLRDGWLDLCDARVTIPMQPGVDSLNLGVAAGVFLYDLNRGQSLS
ncbi:MAG: TrmH family RNA methyltransferase [Planctomycetota bacterium]